MGDELQISAAEYRFRLESLQSRIGQAGLELFVVSSFDSIYYLTGAGFEPLERPFFLLVRPTGAPTLLVPRLDHEHMKKARNIPAQSIRSYREYPAPAGESWPDRLRDELGDAKVIGVEPSLRQEIAEQLRGYTVRAEPLVEQLRLVKSETEVRMIRRAAKFADFGVERLLASSYFGATVAEGFAETRGVTLRIVRDVDDWEPLTTKVVMATWAAPRSGMPHSIPDLNDRLREGPHVALVLTRVNGYAAESERTYFTSTPSSDDKQAFAAMTEARRLAFQMIRPGVACGEIDGKVNEFLSGEGYGDYDQRLHRTGHGFGLGNHEAPFLAEGSDERLARNMVVSIEPGIYLKGHGGFRHSDTVLITDDGYEKLTRLPVELEQLVMPYCKPLAWGKGHMIRRALRLSRKASQSVPCETACEARK